MVPSGFVPLVPPDPFDPFDPPSGLWLVLQPAANRNAIPTIEIKALRMCRPFVTGLREGGPIVLENASTSPSP
jgi:hypothetical protein